MRVRWLALAALLALSGCESLSYYAQAVGGQLEMMHRAQPLADWISDPATPPELRRRLELAARIRGFASRELALPENGSYRSYADLGRPYAVWNVFAAPEFSVKPVESCFPIAGCVAYRGFFAREGAEGYAARKRAEGLDVFAYGVPAYSTLGWFDDPLLSTFIHYPEWELARLIFHELAHQVVYVKGDTTFNESFAVTVQDEGVRRWLESEGRGTELAAFREAETRKAEFVALIEHTRARLARRYAEPLAPAAMRAAKGAEFARLAERYAGLKARWGGYTGFDRLMRDPNNALLASISAYARLVPAFRRELAAAHGDLAAFYSRVKALARLPKAERDAALSSDLSAQREIRSPTL
ncbi:MAG TPA: aminopeptidase [Burkholderiales bacterium]|nr:aminopeptidase [Burkholderiales bacterium]